MISSQTASSPGDSHLSGGVSIGQKNFNPSWMPQSPVTAPASSKSDKPNGFAQREDPTTASQEMIEPIFAKNRYGREDLLALIGKEVKKPPEGLEQCPFFMEEVQPPIILQSLTETETRLQTNINSSKAVSSLSRQDRHQMLNNGGGGGSGEGAPSTVHTLGGGGAGGGGGWTVAGPARSSHTNKPQPVQNRWSALSSGNSGPDSQSATGNNSSSSGTSSYRSGARGGMQSSSSTFNRNNGSGGGGQKMPHSDYRSSSNANSNSTSTIPSNINRNRAPNSINEDSPPIVSESTARPPFGHQHSIEMKRAFGGSQLTKPASQTSIDSAVISSASVCLTKNVSEPPEDVFSIQSMAPMGTAPPPLKQHEHSSSSSPPPSTTANKEPARWHYLDPSGIQRGPFETHQMQNWYSSGYFSKDLHLRRITDKDYTTLGELVRLNGEGNPFIGKVPSPSPIIAATILMANSYSQQSSADAWGIPTTTTTTHHHNSTNIERATEALKEKERLILEEKMKLAEKEERLRREDNDRQEKEMKIREMELKLLRQQEELQRIAHEREQQLEEKRLQVLEYERQKREALQRMESQMRMEHLQQQRMKEEEDKRREQELADRQRRHHEAELQFKRDEEEARIAYEEARRLQEQALLNARLIDEQQQRARIAEHAEMERRRQQQQQREEAKQSEAMGHLQLQQQVVETEGGWGAAPKGAAVDPWTTVGVKKPTSSSSGADTRNLADIQREEELAAKKQREMLAIANQKKADEWAKTQQQQQQQQEKSAWGPVSHNFPTFQPPSPPTTAAATPQPHHPHQQQQRSGWNQVIAPQAVPIPKAPQKPQLQSKKAKQKEEAAKAKEVKQSIDPFVSWIIKRVGELNSSVDAPVFAQFIEGIDSPNEVEDYIIGYFGESKSARDFHKELLTKRIELRPRVKMTDKDDLSAAATATTSSSGTASNATAGGNGAGNKKAKKAKGQKKVLLDGAALGFRPAANPNRVNAGEIDTEAPVPTRKR